MENQYEFNMSGISEVLVGGIVDVDLSDYQIDRNIKRDRKGRCELSDYLCYHLEKLDKEAKEKLFSYEGDPMYN